MHPIGATSRAWLDQAESTDALAPLTIASYSRHLAAFTAHVGDGRDVATITADDIAAWLAALKRDGISSSTRNTRRSSVAAFLRWCRERELMAHDPMRQVARARVGQRPVPRLTMEQVGALLAAADRHDGTRLMILLAVQCWLRRGELATLTVGDWRRADAVLLVRDGKGLKSREVPVPDEARAELDWWLWVGDNDGRPVHRVSGPVWPSPRHPGRPLAERTINARVARAGRRAGVRAWPHLFRHTGISDAAELGAEPAAMAAVAGHSDPGMTLRVYVHPRASSRAEAVAGRSYLTGR